MLVSTALALSGCATLTGNEPTDWLEVGPCGIPQRLTGAEESPFDESAADLLERHSTLNLDIEYTDGTSALPTDWQFEPSTPTEFLHYPDATDDCAYVAELTGDGLWSGGASMPGSTGVYWTSVTDEPMVGTTGVAQRSDFLEQVVSLMDDPPASAVAVGIHYVRMPMGDATFEVLVEGADGETYGDDDPKLFGAP